MNTEGSDFMADPGVYSAPKVERHCRKVEGHKEKFSRHFAL